MIYISKRILSAKQVGPVYHYTTSFDRLQKIVESSELMPNSVGEKGVYFISFTRDKRLMPSKPFSTWKFGVQVDGDALTNRSRVVPVNYFSPFKSLKSIDSSDSTVELYGEGTDEEFFTVDLNPGLVRKVMGFALKKAKENPDNVIEKNGHRIEFDEPVPLSPELYMNLQNSTELRESEERLIIGKTRKSVKVNILKICIPKSEYDLLDEDQKDWLQGTGYPVDVF